MHLFEATCVLIRNYDCTLCTAETLFYLAYSQYQYYITLHQYNLENPVCELANAMHDTTMIIHLFSKCELSDSCSAIMERILKSLQQPETLK